MKIRKAVIPAAGLGTRFLPATKAMPKEMMPIIDKPAIQYIVEEVVSAGIQDIIIISGRGKRAIEDHFDKSYELEETLFKREKTKILRELEQISDLANIHYIRQKEPKGLGDAILCAKSFIGREPFAVLLGDDIIQSDVPCLGQLMDVYHQHRCPVIGVEEVPEEDVHKYGIIAPDKIKYEQHTMKVKTLVEKPEPNQAPSRFGIVGRYILTPDIFDILSRQEPGKGGEIQLTDSIKTLNERRTVLACQFKGVRYDIGEKLGFIKATLDFALQREDLKEEVVRYIHAVAKTHEHMKVVI